MFARIPNPTRDPLLYDISAHGPYVVFNQNCPYMKDGHWSKALLPAKLIEETWRRENGYPKYIRRSLGDGSL